MGQRLVINIYSTKLVYENEELVDVKDTLVANGYYHWSGYNECAHEYLNQMQSFLNSECAEKICSNVVEGGENNLMYIKELAIRMLEYTGAGLNVLARKEFEEDVKEGKCPNWEIQDAVDRNEGLLEINEVRMRENQDWSEFDLNLYIDEDYPLINEVGFGGDIEFDNDDDRRKQIHPTMDDVAMNRGSSGSSFGYDKDGNFCKLS